MNLSEEKNTNDTDDSDGDNIVFKNFEILSNVTETSQICLKFAEEIRNLRRVILELKEDKRTWLLSNKTLTAELRSKDDLIAALKFETRQLSEDNLIQRRQLLQQVT